MASVSSVGGEALRMGISPREFDRVAKPSADDVTAVTSDKPCWAAASESYTRPTFTLMLAAVNVSRTSVAVEKRCSRPERMESRIWVVNSSSVPAMVKRARTTETTLAPGG